MLSLPVEWIFHEPYSTHTWMDGVFVYYSMTPWPWLYIPFILFIFPPILAKDKRGAMGFMGILVLERIFGVTIAGYLLLAGACLWSFAAFRRNQVSRSLKLATGLALLSLTVAVLLGFPRVVSFSPEVCRINLRNIDMAIQMYQTDWSGALPPTLTSLTPNYLKTIPHCPVDTTIGDSLSWKIEAERYILSCENPIHKFEKMKVKPLVTSLTSPR